jgi:hypothetical protein
MILKQIYLYPDLGEFAGCPQDLLAVRDQTRHICNYLERQLASLRFDAAGFNKICVIGYSIPPAEMLINTCQSLSVPIEFDMSACRRIPRDLLGDYYAGLLAGGLRKCSSRYEIPLDEMLGWLTCLKQQGYRNEWMFKERTFRQHGLKCRLHCALTLDAFALRLQIARQGCVLFDEAILTTPPDEIAFGRRFKDIVLEGDHLTVTTKLHTEDRRVLYKIALSALPSNLPEGTGTSKARRKPA